MSLYGELIEAIRIAVPDATIHMDKSTSGGTWSIVKLNGKTLGYVNGKVKLRIDSPKIDRKVLIVHPAQIPVGVEFIQSYIPQEAAT